MLVERARQRVNYPRPWGIPVYLTDAPVTAEEEEPKIVSSEESPDEKSVDIQL